MRPRCISPPCPHCGISETCGAPAWLAEAELKAQLNRQVAEIRAAGRAEIDKILADLDAKLAANAAQQAKVKAEMAKEP